MATNHRKTLTKFVGAAVGVTVLSYAAFVATTWWRYGRISEPCAGERDALLNRFMPEYDVVERHHVRVAAPADITLAAAKNQNLFGSVIVRAIFKIRELVLGAKPEERAGPRTLLSEVQSLGWGVLADVPGREIVVGAVTRPWEPNVTFRAVPPDEFAAFDEPGYVKIAWTLRVTPVGTVESIFRTETRATTTDLASRARFRKYWSFASPGIILIRLISLGPLKREAERLARGAWR